MAETETTVTERQREAFKVTKNYMWFSMAAGLMPVPYVDWVVVSGVQLKMLAELSKVYGVPFKANLGKAAIASLAGFVLPHAMAFGWLGSVLKSLPLVGSLAGIPAMAVFTGGYTWALGMVFIQHFESGGTFLNFHPEEVKEYFRAQFAEGRKVATNLGRDKKSESPA
ncbi:MAG TPA: DUF697 domain-containing protein [Bryobacteraceae bacterium]|nr:DUF697 domain-containing protein [Bryobacteraceae bacterium]